jgi:NADH:ubiquinone oxidoreductase subunit
MAKKAAAKKTKRKEWTKDDVRDLRALGKAKTPAGKIAKKLKRTEGAVRQKAFSLGLSLDSRG